MTDDNTDDRQKRRKPEEVAEILEIPIATLKKALKRGDCRGIEFGARIGWRTTVADAEAWLDALTADRDGRIREMDIERIADRLRAVGLAKIADAVESLPELEADAERSAA